MDKDIFRTDEKSLDEGIAAGSGAVVVQRRQTSVTSLVTSVSMLALQGSCCDGEHEDGLPSSKRSCG